MISLLFSVAILYTTAQQVVGQTCQTPIVNDVSFEPNYPFQAAQPESGADFYAYFKVTVPYSEPTQVPSNVDFKVQPAGEISSIQQPADCEEAMCPAWIVDGVVELNNFWSAPSTTFTMAVGDCQTTYIIDHPPLCYPYGVYQPQCGSVGPVTDEASANIVVVCTESVGGLCFPNITSCVSVSGPSNATITTAQDIEPSNQAYTQLGVSWKDFDPTYMGKVTIDVKCDLQDSAGQSQIRPFLPYTLTRIPYTSILNPVYKVETSSVHPFSMEIDNNFMAGQRQPRESSAK